jgi:membrane-associated phospholipid phosphatase
VPLSRAGARQQLLRRGVNLQYLLLAVAVPVAVAEIIKWTVGRGRPFVGGKADAFNFAPFNGTEAHFSLPSAHAVTAFALAFGVAAIWPRTRVIMAVYAVVILMTRLVLLAHHPSDVVAGAVIGVVGALMVRYWFAARQLGFAIDDKGEIAPL